MVLAAHTMNAFLIGRVEQYFLISCFAVYTDFTLFMTIGAPFYILFESSMKVFFEISEKPVFESASFVTLLVVLAPSEVVLGVMFSSYFHQLSKLKAARQKYKNFQRAIKQQLQPSIVFYLLIGDN